MHFSIFCVSVRDGNEISYKVYANQAIDRWTLSLSEVFPNSRVDILRIYVRSISKLKNDCAIRFNGL